MEVLRTKSVEQALADAEEPEHGLRRALGPLQLTLLGIGVIIGTGIFVLTGETAGTIAGSAHTFSYASIGELLAWIIGWDLILELALGAATVAEGWSQYL